MSLGLLARDSVQDLSAMGREETTNYRSSFTEPARKNPQFNSLDISSASFESGSKLKHSSVPRDDVKTSATPSRTNSSTVIAISLEPTRRNLPTDNEANPQQPPSYQYAGFAHDYDYEAYADHDNYAPDFLAPANAGRTTTGRFWCCIFPWMASLPSKKIEEPHERTVLPSDAEEPAGDVIVVEPRNADEDAESTNSNVLGELLSDKERQAVLARLRLAQPDIIVQHNNNKSSEPVEEQGRHESSKRDSSSSEKSKLNKGLLNGITVYDTTARTQEGPTTTPTLKGILKKRSTAKIDEHVMTHGTLERRLSNTAVTLSSGSLSTAVVKPQAGMPRRSLFPSYEDRSKTRATKSVTFSPMARVIAVKSRNDMPDDEKGDIWWRRSDYEDFRKAGRIITRAMLEGGSEIWLASTEKDITHKKGGSSIHAGAVTVPGDKWWHKFGHSRRGLEHVVSIDEGRQRQANVKNSIRAVLEEQARQKMYRREDPDKLRSVALHQTTWARDLALASGASDADAVERSFAEDRRSREFFLLKMSRTNPGAVDKSGLHVPQFMQPAMHRRVASSSSSGPCMVQQRLDAHTAAQIQFRRQKQLTDSSVVAGSVEKDEESQVLVHDPDPDDKNKESLAHQAAGFAATGEKVNMAAVLSGMGALPNEEQPPIMRVAS